VEKLEGLQTAIALIVTALVGVSPTVLVTAVTSLINRSTARTELEIARLRQHKPE
jgi:hypothetical protein